MKHMKFKIIFSKTKKKQTSILASRHNTAAANNPAHAIGITIYNAGAIDNAPILTITCPYDSHATSSLKFKKIDNKNLVGFKLTSKPSA